MRLAKTGYLMMHTFESMQRGSTLNTLSTILVWGGTGLVGSIVVYNQIRILVELKKMLMQISIRFV